MSHPPHRLAAWNGLAEQPLVYAEPARALEGALRQALSAGGRLRLIANLGDEISQFLRFDPLDTLESPLFLKVAAVHRTASLAQAEAIASWLLGRGVTVAAGRQQATLADGRTLWAYPFLDGRVPAATEADMLAIGHGLGQLHRALADHPERAHWLERTDRRLAALAQVRSQLASGALRAGPEPERLAELAADDRLSFLPADHAGVRTPLHGDLHRFNLLMVDGECTFLDFEDVVHNVAPAIFDIATIFERVVLAAPKATEPTRQDALLAVLLKAYHDAAGTTIAAEAVSHARRGLALRALCTLAASDPEGADDGEWRKFFHLLDLGAPHVR